MKTAHIRDYPGGRIHMIGIGGSSMSGLAEMLIDQGYRVSGSDRDETYLVHYVREKNAEVFIGHKAENVRGADLVVYSAAISKDNPERAEAERLGIPCIERATLLGQLMEGYPSAVGVCGAHGKTTVTSMLSQMLMESGLDPSIHIGGRLDAIGGSTRVGHSSIFVAEACEYNRSFLHLSPTVAVVLNIDADHLDCYRDIDEIEQTFGQFLSLLPNDGTAIGNGDDPRIVRCFGKLKCRTILFGMDRACEWHPENMTEDDRGYAAFDLFHNGKAVAAVRMNVPGRFNVMNALASVAAAVHLGVDPEKAAETLGRFSGAHRRFELTDSIDGVEIFHDYGHNPAEMRNAVSIARKRCKGRLWAVMQPHTFSRVRTLFGQYLTCTEEADFTLVTDICAAREKDPGDLNSGMLVQGMREHGINAVWTPSFDDTESYLKEHWQPGDLVITMGCGDINLLNDQIHRHFQESEGKEK
ncbi:MAG: UDP-N-acetylmuramate--L-alanine ligase [Clostridia bacterium]|nr:UDP-N-acetylmuramate--L-alanine ligase [Clostridia bacterium]